MMELLLVLMPSLRAESINFDLALLLSSNATIGKPCTGREPDAGKNRRNDDGSLVIDGETYLFYIADRANAERLTCSRSVVMWEDYGGDRMIIWSPETAIFPAPTASAGDLQRRSANLRSIGRRFMEGATCPTAMSKLVEALDGADQQSAIDRLFHDVPTEVDDIRCLVTQLSSESVVERDYFSPPYPSSEGMYYHGIKRRGDLVAILLPNLFNVSIGALGGIARNEGERHRVDDAWAYWAACRFDKPVCISSSTPDM